MKRLIILVSVVLMFCAASFASAEEAGSKALVVVFSRAGENYSVGVIEEGNTSKMAKIIAEQTGADLFFIEPVIPYPENYDTMLTVATQEKNDDARPEYAGDVENWEQYGTVFIGYPIWWGGVPNIVYLFLEKHDFIGKTVIPFNTHEGSGQAGTQQDIESRLPGITVLQGLAVRGSKAQNDMEGTAQEVQDWLKQLDLIQ